MLGLEVYVGYKVLFGGEGGGGRGLMLYRAYRVWWLVALIRTAFGVRRLSRINTYIYI